MRIGIDARMIQHSGIGVYIKSLLEELLPAAKKQTFVLFGPRHAMAELEFANDNVKIVNCEIPIYSVREQLFHPALREKLDLYHVPHYNFPVFYRGKIVITLHDLNHLVMPELLPNRFALPYAKFMIKKAYEKADRMICVSKATQRDLEHFYGDTDDFCRVIHEAVRPEFLAAWSEEEKAKVRIRYRLPQKYALTVGILKPHKNILTLLHIFRQLRKEGLINHHLVIVGKRFDRHPEILVEIHKGEREGYIRHLENVPAQDLPGIYQMADVFSFISRHEGFGLPVLEAFASKVPVLASNSSSIPEVAGSGAVFADPNNPAEIKQGLLALLRSEQLRRELSKKGAAELVRFSWKKTALETLKVYEEAVGSSDFSRSETANKFATTSKGTM